MNRQPDLVLPTAGQPRQVADAARVYAERLADLRAANEREQEAQAGVEQARRLDIGELASWRDDPRGVEPGRDHEQRALEEVDAASRSAGAERLRVERSRADLLAALERNGQSWQSALTRERSRLDGKAAELLAELQRVEARRQEARATSAWVAAVLDLPEGPSRERQLRVSISKYSGSAPTQVPDARNSNRMLDVAELLNALDEYVTVTSVASSEREPAAV